MLAEHGVDPEQDAVTLAADIDGLEQADFLSLNYERTMLDQSSPQRLRKNDVRAEINLLATRKWTDGMREMVPAAQTGMKQNLSKVKTAIRSGDREAFDQRMIVMRSETQDLTKRTDELRDEIMKAVSNRLSREQHLFDQQERNALSNQIGSDLRNAPAIVSYLSLPSQLDEEMIRVEAQREHDATADQSARNTAEHGASFSPHR